jgi:hypothetical protein
MWRNILFGAAAACVAASSAQATVLTFDTDITNPLSMPLSQDYGDRVSAALQGVMSYGVGAEGFTPNVLVEYRGNGSSADIVRWPTAYGDLVNVIYNDADNDTRLQILFTADPGYDVVLHGFDLAGWPLQDYTIPGVFVTSGPSLLFAESGVLVHGAPPAPLHTSFEFAGGLNGGQSLSLLLDLTGLRANSRNIGIDNIRFSQVSLAPPPAAVPEPATWAMLVLGFGGLGGLLRSLAAARRRAVA